MRKIILIVDDEEPNREYLKTIISSEEYSFLEASSGKECLEILDKEEVNLILLDVLMPQMTGYEVLKQIRANSRTKVIPVILLTALKEKEDRIKGIDLGADDFISKPFDRTELLVRIKNQMRMSFLRNQLSEKERTLRIIERSENGIIITDGLFRPIVINKKAKELLEIEEFPEDIVQYIRDKFLADFDSNVAVHEILIQRPETQKYNPLYLSVVFQPIRGFQDEIDSYILFLQDVTDQHLKNRIRYDFLSLISHKLRTPLTTIKGVVHYLNKEIKEGKYREFVESLSRQSLNLEGLISRLLFFVEVQNENLNEEKELIELDKMIDELKMKYKVDNIEVKKQIDVGKIFFWQYVVLRELIDNSIKFFDKDSLELNIRISKNILEVSDNGPGLPPEEQEKVFEPFYQVEKYLTYNIPGIGLGLSLVKRLAEIEQHKVTLYNNKPSGLVVRAES